MPRGRSSGAIYHSSMLPCRVLITLSLSFVGKDAEHGERALGGQGVEAAGKGAGGVRVVRHV